MSRIERTRADYIHLRRKKRGFGGQPRGLLNAELEADQRFCDECGTPVDGAAAATPAANADTSAVRKTVTVLFADLGGSTGFGERNDPEVARTARSASSSAISGSPNVAIIPSPMNFATVPPCASIAAWSSA